jgi:hypothetical protein
VELGKVLATKIAGELTSDTSDLGNHHDSSTAALISRYRTRRMRPGG